MSHTLHGENLAAFTQGRTFSWRASFARLADTAQTWRRRQRERRELLYFLATDHRAAMDLGTDLAGAREWADRPFWQG
jgi:uncharacterized protein YjiS (DUF1127 family)